MPEHAKGDDDAARNERYKGLRKVRDSAYNDSLAILCLETSKLGIHLVTNGCDGTN